METMFQYINETPKQCLENIENSKELTKDIVNAFLEKDYKRIQITASGSSFNGSQTAKYFIEKLLKMKVEICTSFTMENYETIFDQDTFYVGMGQSGRSMNTNHAMKRIQEHGHKVVGVTGNVESVMKDNCDVICNWGMGIEKIGFVTKGYSTSVLFYILFALEAALGSSRISAEEYDSIKSELREMVAVMEKAIPLANKWYADNEEELTDFKRVQVLGYGPNYGVALEGALKIEETMGKASTGWEMEEFLHGPYIETNHERTVFVIDSLGNPSDRAVKLYHELHSLTPHVFLITNKKIEDRHVLTIDHQLSEHFSTLVNVIAFQTVAANGNAKWVNPIQETRLAFIDRMSSKSPKTGKEVGL